MHLWVAELPPDLLSLSPGAIYEKEGQGFQSRVGAMLKKKKKKPRKPRKKTKGRKKPAKKEVEKQEPVMEVKKVIEIPPSPKIKKTKKPAVNFPDFVRKRRKKKYLN